MANDENPPPPSFSAPPQVLEPLAAILPPDLRDRVAEFLTPQDVATLTHLAKEGMGQNTVRAIASDLNYLETWALAATGAALPWPAPEALVLKFVAHHLYDPAERARDPEHGMPADVVAFLTARKCLRSDGPHAPATVRRRLALWSTLHRWRGVVGTFSSPNIRNAMRLAVRAADRPRKRKSANPVTRDVVDRLLATCLGHRLVDIRDRALLLVAFGCGGRRRSEVARLRLEDIVERPPIRSSDPHEDPLPVYAIRLGRTKTSNAESDDHVLLIGRAALHLKEWLLISLIRSGPLFRRIDRWERLGTEALDAQSVNLIVKKRCRMAGLSASLYSAHGLRSGYMTEAARQGVPMQEAMRQSRHRSVQQAADYYNEVDLARGNAARLG